ncbi:MAG: amidohydrolase, partial [Bacteroidota bacterium]
MMHRTIFALLMLLSCQCALMAQVDFKRLLETYQHLHAHPELSFYEKETSAYLAKEMRRIGYEVTEGIGGYGVVGVLRNGEGPVVMYRTDTDALPIVEETGLSYASKVVAKDEAGKEVGVMHACGHDMHMAVWLGAAEQLAALRAQWKGTLVFIAQPAEERSGGAKAMLADGLFERFPKPDYALALHVSSTMAAGTVGYKAGFMMANVDMVDIEVYGKGGHGAYPHTTIDPVVIAARIIMALQTIVSREVSPLEPAVITVGAIHGGTKGNVIPDEVKMELTLRSYSKEVRDALIERIGRTIAGVAESAGVPEELMPKLTVRPEFTPALYNDPALTARIAGALAQKMGEEQVIEQA